jgi:hypothetical protein
MHGRWLDNFIAGFSGGKKTPGTPGLTVAAVLAQPRAVRTPNPESCLAVRVFPGFAKD